MSVQILLTAAARGLAIIELQIKAVERHIITVPVTASTGFEIEDMWRDMPLGFLPVLGSQWARMTFNVAEIRHIAEANAYMYERTEGEWDRLSVIELNDGAVLLVRSAYDELRAVLYGVSHAPILNVTTN